MYKCHAYLRFKNGFIVKTVFVYIGLHSDRSIDCSLRIDKSKLIKIIQFFHTGLIRLKVCFVTQILFCQKIYRNPDRFNILLQVIPDDLFTPSRKFVQLHKADRTNGFVGISFFVAAQPHRCTSTQASTSNCGAV